MPVTCMFAPFPLALWLGSLLELGRRRGDIRVPRRRKAVHRYQNSQCYPDFGERGNVESPAFMAQVSVRYGPRYRSTYSVRAPSRAVAIAARIPHEGPGPAHP